MIVTLFAPEATPDGRVRVPSLCAHVPVAEGTVLLFENDKLEFPELHLGMNRRAEPFLLRRVLWAP